MGNSLVYRTIEIETGSSWMHFIFKNIACRLVFEFKIFLDNFLINLVWELF